MANNIALRAAYRDKGIYACLTCVLKAKVKFSPLQALEALRVVRG
jgi:hypothetical protein